MSITLSSRVLATNKQDRKCFVNSWSEGNWTSRYDSLHASNHGVVCGTLNFRPSANYKIAKNLIIHTFQILFLNFYICFVLQLKRIITKIQGCGFLIIVVQYSIIELPSGFSWWQWFPIYITHNQFPMFYSTNCSIGFSELSCG